MRIFLRKVILNKGKEIKNSKIKSLKIKKMNKILFV